MMEERALRSFLKIPVLKILAHLVLLALTNIAPAVTVRYSAMVVLAWHPLAGIILR